MAMSLRPRRFYVVDVQLIGTLMVGHAAAAAASPFAAVRRRDGGLRV